MNVKKLLRPSGRRASLRERDLRRTKRSYSECDVDDYLYRKEYELLGPDIVLHCPLCGYLLWNEYWDGRCAIDSCHDCNITVQQGEFNLPITYCPDCGGDYGGSCHCKR